MRLGEMGLDLWMCCFTSTSDTFRKQTEWKWQIFPYHKLKIATNYFHQARILDKKGSATVYYGKLKNGREIAVQSFKEDKCNILKQFIEETVILNFMPYKNLVTIYGYSTHQKEFLLVHEYLSNGTLATHIKGQPSDSRTTLTWPNRLDIAIDIASALNYLHYKGIVHRNVKSNNIFLDINFCAKLGNFHLSKKLVVEATDVTRDLIGTSGYIDPELVSKGLLSVKNDVYSFGVVLCELVSSMLAEYYVHNEEESLATFLMTKVENQALVELLDPNLGFQSDVKIDKMMTATAELAFWCLQCPQELRPNMEQVLESLNGIKQGRYELSPIKAFKIFHHAELEEATNHFDTFLGKGGFGSVYYGKLKDGREVGIKRFHEETNRTIKQFMKEIEIASHLRHQNLVLLYGCSSRHSDKHMLVYEYISNGTLSQHLHGSSGSTLSWPSRLNIAIETAKALVYLHDSGIIHRDIKGSNILLDENLTVKVADFGLSRFLPDYVTHVSTLPVGTRAYIDPDYFETGRVSDKSDVYSFGVILFELISSKPASLMQGTENVTLAQFAMHKILNKNLQGLVDQSLAICFNENVVEMITAVTELAFQCVQCPKELRPTMKQVLQTLQGISKGTWGFNQIT
ncbi:probable LRR receptor-like serine/threonine-protein kinase At1g07560 isoform X1 [Vicia villosa]|uniref:probable LRR receptor-like serine/threonine-protein kinase At1g07560 isoform X1 n=1 Tax=Vicia villosa TaxID=3911 RepID=UPI00273B8A1A|nr:probable LRR receptor-like serine/threonine-protein kinase At1g07560 isoform X1 [Vicia villosa]XP_058722470.1 probable LRR receptor-like serine/threonine-protein kinase At1g07560 isoform X1 [Vicia villosa]